MATEKTGTCARRRKVLGIWAIVGVAVFVVVDRVLWWLRSSNEKMVPHLLDAAVVFIALAAVAVSLWHGWLMRKHARLSIKPFLDFFWNVHELNGLILLNGGLGTAIVKELCIAVDDNHLEPATDELWAYVKKEMGLGSFDTFTLVGNTIIPPSLSIPVIQNLHGKYITIVEEGDEDICQKKLRIKATYKSASGESFETPTTTTLAKVPPKNSDACPCTDSG